MNKYFKTFVHSDENGSLRYVKHDVYDVLVAFGITCPATAHAIKKLLMAGERGHKDRETDLREAIEAIQRALEMEVPA